MNIIEATSFFVRVTSFDFRNRDERIKIKFRIVPMIHIGDKAYYQQALTFLEQCDEIIYEGIYCSKTKSTTNLYKAVAEKVGLVTQREYLNLQKVSSKLIHADYTKDSGLLAWKQLKFKEKLIMQFVIPLKLLYESWTLNRKQLAKQFMHSNQELYLAYGQREDELRTVGNFIMNTREQIIFRIINQKMKTEANQDKLIGILYGAGHMKTICRYLIDKQNYIPHNGRFLKVFTI